MIILYWICWSLCGIGLTTLFGYMVAEEFKVKHFLLTILIGSIFGYVAATIIILFIIVCMLISLFRSNRVKQFLNKKVF